MNDPVQACLDVADDALEARWGVLMDRLTARFGQAPGIEAVLFLVGIQAQGRGFEPRLEKETKQALIMEGTYCVFEAVGLYERAGMEADGSWIWERVVDWPELSVDAQEKLLRVAILRYFEGLWEESES